MVLVQSILEMVLPALHLPSHVRIGSIKMVLKIIHFTVSFFFFFIFKRIHSKKIIQGWTTNPSERTIVAFSSVSTIQVRLPAGGDRTSVVNIIGIIRDGLDCITEMNLSSVVVSSDSEEITNFVVSIQSTKTNDPIVQTLSSGNQNLIGQVITSVSLEFNKINNQTIENAVASKNNRFSIYVFSSFVY